MSVEEKAYQLGRAWRRGEINGYQFDWRLSNLGVTDDFVSSVVHLRDREDLKVIIKEFCVAIFVLLIFSSIVVVSKSEANWSQLDATSWKFEKSKNNQ